MHHYWYIFITQKKLQLFAGEWNKTLYLNELNVTISSFSKGYNRAKGKVKILYSSVRFIWLSSVYRVTKILRLGIPPGFCRLTVTVVKDYHAAVRIILQLSSHRSFSVNDAFIVGQENVATPETWGRQEDFPGWFLCQLQLR